MRHKLLVGIGALMVVAHSSFAGDNASVNINAIVQGTCKFNVSTATINVTLDPSSGQDVTGTGALQFWCTKKTSYNITRNNGQNPDGNSGNPRVKHQTDDEYIPYSITYTPSSGQGQGPQNPIPLTVTVNFLYNDFANAPEGTYTDTITFQINP